MIFFLLWLSSIIFLIATFLIVFLLNYKQGKFVNKKWIFILITIIILLGLLINLYSLANNYTKQRLFIIFMIIISLLNLLIYNKYFDISRVLLSFISFMSLLIYNM